MTEDSAMARTVRPLRTKIAPFRLTEDEYALVSEQAEAAGISFSRYCRSRVLKHRVLASADRVVLRELRRLGGLLKHTHNQTRGVYAEEFANALAELTACIARIARQ